jgi:hypothetical protein
MKQPRDANPCCNEDDVDRECDLSRMASRGIALVVLLIVVFCYVNSVSAQSQKPNYLWDGWHKVHDPSHIQYKIFHDKVVELSNLSNGCEPASSFSFAGKIATVNFDKQGSLIENFVLETSDGERSLIKIAHISMDDPGMTTVDLSWIVRGLQTLLRPNWYVQGSAIACGASEKVLMLDKILSASSKPISSLLNQTALPNGNSRGQIHSQQTQTGTSNTEGIRLSVQAGPLLFLTLSMINSGAADVSFKKVDFTDQTV